MLSQGLAQYYCPVDQLWLALTPVAAATVTRVQACDGTVAVLI